MEQEQTSFQLTVNAASLSQATVVSNSVVHCPLQGAHSTSGADNEYNLRSRTVICDSCGQPSDRSSGVGSSGSLPEGLVGHSFFMGTNEPRQVLLQHEQQLHSIMWNSMVLHHSF